MEMSSRKIHQYQAAALEPGACAVATGPVLWQRGLCCGTGVLRPSRPQAEPVGFFLLHFNKIIYSL